MEGQILILDPEEVVTPILAPPLRAEGFSVTVSDDMAVARQLIKHVKPDVVLAERLRHMVDGFAFCGEIKGNPETASIVVFIMSDKGGKVVEKEGAVVGCDGVLKRPIDLGMLLLKIRNGILARVAKGGAGTTDGFSGNLSEIGFTDMIQIVCAGGKTLVVELAHAGDRGTVYVSKGDVIHAKVGKLAGSAAFHAMMRWKEGTFHSRQEADFPERTIKESVMGLLMEGARLEDEG
jgi:CheY-like chemotaxis protein